MILSPQHTTDTRLLLAPAGRTTAQTPSTGEDCRGYDFAKVVVSLGVLDSGGALTITVHDSPDNSTFTAVTGASMSITDTMDGTVKFGTVRLNPRARYIKCNVAVAGSQSMVYGINLELSGMDRQLDQNVASAALFAV